MAFNAFKLKRARKILEDAGIDVGVTARITWVFEGGGLGSGVECNHEGPVSFYDGEWIELKPTVKSPGHLRLPIVALVTGHKVEVVDEDGTLTGVGEPPKTNWEDPGPPRENPFIKKANQKGSTNG